MDLVVLDCSMPGLTGREVYERLPGAPDRPRVLFMTGYTKDALEGLEPNAGWALLRKPFDAAGLLAAAGEILRQRAA